MDTVARNRIKDFCFETNKTSLYHLHSIKEIASDERKTLTKNSRNLSQQFPHTSTRFGHGEIIITANRRHFAQLEIGALHNL